LPAKDAKRAKEIDSKTKGQIVETVDIVGEKKHFSGLSRFSRAKGLEMEGI